MTWFLIWEDFHSWQWLSSFCACSSWQTKTMTVILVFVTTMQIMKHNMNGAWCMTNSITLSGKWENWKKYKLLKLCIREGIQSGSDFQLLLHFNHAVMGDGGKRETVHVLLCLSLKCETDCIKLLHCSNIGQLMVHVVKAMERSRLTISLARPLLMGFCLTALFGLRVWMCSVRWLLLVSTLPKWIQDQYIFKCWTLSRDQHRVTNWCIHRGNPYIYSQGERCVTVYK